MTQISNNCLVYTGVSKTRIWKLENATVKNLSERSIDYQCCKGEGLNLSSKEIHSVFEPFVSSHTQASDPQWKQQLSERKLKIARKYIRKLTLGWVPGYQRNSDLIIDEYSDVWTDTRYENYSLEVPPPRFSPWEWNDDRMLASAFGGTRVRQLLLAKAIEQLKPKKVLEVGCGNGINLLMLSGRFPEIEFTGVELTKEGHEAALSFQRNDTFPELMRSYAPQPMLDDTAFKRIRFLQGSAEKLPLGDNEVDFVYTVLALEQMERIRKQALSEVARVAKKNTLMIEPFRDVNNSGWERANVIRRNYFRGNIQDLPNYGLNPVTVTSDFPQEVFLKACAVVSEAI